MEKKTKNVVTRAIILVDGKILLGKRARGHGANQYALVGGKPEPGESMEEAVIREVKEEIGILFKNVVSWKKEIDKNSIPEESWDVYYFYGEGEGPLVLEKDEIVDTILVDKNDYKSVDLGFDHRRVLKEFFEEALVD